MLAVELFCPDHSDQRQGTANESLVKTDIVFFGSWQIHNHQLIRKKCKKNCSDSSVLDMASDKTQVRSNQPLIRSLRPKRPLTRPSRPNWLLIRPKSDNGQDYFALELLSRSCNFGLGTRVCVRVGLILAHFASAPQPGKLILTMQCLIEIDNVTWIPLKQS